MSATSGAVARAARAARAALPHGQLLTPEVWARRHRGIVVLLDLPPGGGHRGYAAVVDGSGLMVAWRCSHSMGGRKPRVECSRKRLYQAIQRKMAARASDRVR